MKELRDKLRAKLKERGRWSRRPRPRSAADCGRSRRSTTALKAEADSIKVTEPFEERARGRVGRLEAELDAIAPETQAGQRSDAQDTSARARVEVLTPKYERATRSARSSARVTASAPTRRGREVGGAAVRLRLEAVPRDAAVGLHVRRRHHRGELRRPGADRAAPRLGAVRKAGARELPLINGSATIPKVTGGATAYWSATKATTSRRPKRRPAM
jgi:hypothetical protein